MALTKNNTIALTITAIASDGNGVGRHEGQVVFVPGAAAGDTLRVKIVKCGKTCAFGRLEEVLDAGPGRVQDACPVGHICGGCAFGHLSYEAELEAKQGFVADAMRRIGGQAFAPAPILPAPQRTRYRNKVQFPVGTNAQGKLACGLFAARSHRLVFCEDCLLQPKPLNDIAAKAVLLLDGMGVAAYDETAKTGLVRHIYVRQGAHTDEVLLCVVINGDALPDEAGFSDAMRAAFPQVRTVLLNSNTACTNVILGPGVRALSGEGGIHSRLAGVPVKLDVFSFAQVNTEAAEGLFKVVRDFVQPGPHTVLLDMYCGTGVIGLSMAAGCRSLIGVEQVAPAVQAATQSAAAMGLENTRFLCMDAARAAQKLNDEEVRPSAVVLDPPRKGVDKATLGIVAGMGPQRIVMVSCNAATLARDVAELAKLGYTLAALQPVDLFPRTKHVECAALLIAR